MATPSEPSVSKRGNVLRPATHTSPAVPHKNSEAHAQATTHFMKAANSTLLALSILTVCTFSASAQPLGKTLNTGDRILRGSKDWSSEQTQKQILQTRSGDLETVTGQKVLASEKGGNIFVLSDKASVSTKSGAWILGSGDLYGAALRNAQTKNTSAR